MSKMSRYLISTKKGGSMDALKYVAKALTPLAIGAVIAMLGYVGVTEDMTVKEAIQFAVTGALVYLIPNKK